MLELTTSHSKSIFSDNNFITNVEKIIKVGESDISQQVAPNLSVDFSKTILTSLLDMPNCVGIRLYPGIEGGKLVMVAGGVDRNNNDMTAPTNFCAVGYSDGRPSKITTLAIGKETILAEGIQSDTKDELLILQRIPTSNSVFKTQFTEHFLNNALENNDVIRFEVAEFNFGAEGRQRTMVATTLESTNNNELLVSLLPCPPHCGGGDYIPESVLF